VTGLEAEIHQLRNLPLAGEGTAGGGAEGSVPDGLADRRV
jgi:hypothetical protein